MNLVNNPTLVSIKNLFPNERILISSVETGVASFSINKIIESDGSFTVFVTRESDQQSMTYLFEADAILHKL